jgi:hypothetical protein
MEKPKPNKPLKNKENKIVAFFLKANKKHKRRFSLFH